VVSARDEGGGAPSQQILVSDFLTHRAPGSPVSRTEKVVPATQVFSNTDNEMATKNAE
jgi:hypothetical protein